jgi:hypothetical protein
MHHRPPGRPAHRIVPQQPETTLELEPPWSEMIPMHPDLISQLIADRQADLMASARRQRLARQARGARRAWPAQRGRAAPMLAALGRLAWRKLSPRTIQTPAVGPGQAAPTLTPRELDLLKLQPPVRRRPSRSTLVRRGRRRIASHENFWGYPAYVRIIDGTPSAPVGGRRTETAGLRSVMRSRARVDART